MDDPETKLMEKSPQGKPRDSYQKPTYPTPTGFDVVAVAVTCDIFQTHAFIGRVYPPCPFLGYGSEMPGQKNFLEMKISRQVHRCLCLSRFRYSLSMIFCNSFFTELL